MISINERLLELVDTESEIAKSKADIEKSGIEITLYQKIQRLIKDFEGQEGNSDQTPFRKFVDEKIID